MKILVKFNKNIATPKQVKSFKVFNIGIVLTTINDLLDSATIEIDDQTLPVIKLTDNSLEKYYLINDVGLTPGLIYPYYTDDFMKEITIEDLILINTGGGEENVQSDWNQINILADDFIKNKPELFSGDYNDLINTPALVTNHSELNLDDGTNPHGTTKNDVGLGNADNTSDLLKPISNATQSALNSKLDKVTTTDVEKVYIKNADGTQSTKPTSEFGTVKGTGTINRISKFTAGGAIGDSQIFDDGTNVGIGTTSPQARLDVRAQGVLATDIVLRVRNSTDTKNFLVVNGAGDVYNNGARGINSNTFFGENVGRNTTGRDNTAIGNTALRDNTIGDFNTAFGGSALQSNTTGRDNTAIGLSALQSNTTGHSNTAIGLNTLFSNTTGDSNTAIGLNTLFSNTTGYSNTAIGLNTLFSNTTGRDNTAIGNTALRDNTIGEFNTAFGGSALQSNTIGNFNTAFGMYAGRLISDGSNNTITNNSIFIGDNTRALADNQTNQIVIGSNAIGLGSNSVVLGNTSITRTQLRGQVIMGSFASAPTGIEGAIYYDSTTKKHRGFNGTAWNDLY